jgi:SAM-dependent methyltransferase
VGYGRLFGGSPSDSLLAGSITFMAETTIIAEWSGFCPICAKKVVFRADDAWFRDHLLCCSCGSIPRERAVMLVIDDVAPDWRRMRIHECSPVERGTSVRLRNECAAYVGTQLFPGIRPGCMRDGFRCEDLQQQTFGEGSFDLVITQDVMEHVFEPRLAYREIWRTLVPGGMHIHTTPIKKIAESVRRAARGDDGSVRHLLPAVYHASPIDRAGALVTFDWGHDLPRLIAEWVPFEVEVRRFIDRRHGILGEMTDVIICTKF